jgi:hypothetical protein
VNDRATDHDGRPGILLEDCSVEAEGGNKLAPLLVRQGAEWRARVVLMHLGPQYGAGLRPAKLLQVGAAAVVIFNLHCIEKFLAGAVIRRNSIGVA